MSVNPVSAAARHLRDDFAMRVEWADLGDDTLSLYEGAARLFTIHQDLPALEQARALTQAWLLCAFGESAVPEWVGCRHLRAVPPTPD